MEQLTRILTLGIDNSSISISKIRILLRGTKVCGLLTEKNKEYEAVLLLGIETDTQDITGSVLHNRSTEGLTESRVREAIRSFEGDYDQIPPMYSAAIPA